MSTNPNETNPYRSPPVSAVADVPARRRFPWGVVSAIPLFVYGAAPVIGGAWGLMFVPAILLGGVTIGRHTTLPKVFGWVVFHLAITAHGCAIIVAAIRFCRRRWRRGLYAIAVGAIVPGILIAVLYICGL